MIFIASAGAEKTGHCGSPRLVESLVNTSAGREPTSVSVSLEKFGRRRKLLSLGLAENRYGGQHFSEPLADNLPDRFTISAEPNYTALAYTKRFTLLLAQRHFSGEVG